ncbi:ABC transporter permease [Clostridium botulinum]|nr:ABC transporter permease [Clostridium botulinum]
MEIFMIEKLKKNSFLFEELVKRDFKKKYKRAALGMLWSMLSPLMSLLVMALIFTQFFGKNMQHYIIYIFCGNLIFTYFREATVGGMHALTSNAGIITKVNVPKYLFLFSKNISALINFGLSLIIFFIFVSIDGISFKWKFILLLFPIVCLVIFNLGMGLILSAMFVIFKDVQYLYDIFTTLLMYVSAIFYTVTSYPQNLQGLFYLNPIYVFITYFREVVINNQIPSIGIHLLCLIYCVVIFAIGCIIYKKYNYKFLYYM